MQLLASESTLPSKSPKYADSIKYSIASVWFFFHLQPLHMLFNQKTLHLITNINWYWIICHQIEWFLFRLNPTVYTIEAGNITWEYPSLCWSFMIFY
jgi:hypothetical protein